MRVVCFGYDQGELEVLGAKEVTDEAPDATLVLAAFEPSRSAEIELSERFDGQMQWGTDFMQITLQGQERIDNAVFVETFGRDGFVVYEVTNDSGDMVINNIEWHDVPPQEVEGGLNNAGECIYYENAATILWRNAVSDRRPTRSPAELNLGSHVRPVNDVIGDGNWSTAYYAIAGVVSAGAIVAGYKLWSD